MDTPLLWGSPCLLLLVICNISLKQINLKFFKSNELHSTRWHLKNSRSCHVHTRWGMPWVLCILAPPDPTGSLFEGLHNTCGMFLWDSLIFRGEGPRLHMYHLNGRSRLIQKIPNARFPFWKAGSWFSLFSMHLLPFRAGSTPRVWGLWSLRGCQACWFSLYTGIFLISGKHYSPAKWLNRALHVFGKQKHRNGKWPFPWADLPWPFLFCHLCVCICLYTYAHVYMYIYVCICIYVHVEKWRHISVYSEFLQPMSGPCPETIYK